LPRPITIKIKRLSADIPLPRRMSEQAAGFDLCAAVPQPITLPPVVPCGFSMAIPPGYEAQVRPRSGLSSRYGVTLINSPGTIDSDYRGEISVPLINHGEHPVEIHRAMRIAQMVIAAVPQVKMVEVEDLEETGRGSGGFGHTGH